MKHAPMTDAERHQRLNKLGVSPAARWAWDDAAIRRAEAKARKMAKAGQMTPAQIAWQASRDEFEGFLRAVMSVHRIDWHTAFLAECGAEIERRGIPVTSAGW